MLHPIGEPATAYVLKYLQEGHSLSNALAKEVQTVVGEIFAVLPGAADTTKCLDFDSGSLVPPGEITIRDGNRWEKVSPPWAQLAANINDSLPDEPECLCLVEDFLSRPADPFLLRLNERRATHDEEVYVVLRPGELADWLARSSSWHFTCAAGVPDADLFVRDTLTSDEISNFAARTLAVAIQAYDGAGFLLWRRRA
ncbi:MAG TPA: hypothetical protein VEZ14_06090 [Dehalococcoidia bacterium]|nr:hypothetical protein [Dehalococcoidia bacterium]